MRKSYYPQLMKSIFINISIVSIIAFLTNCSNGNNNAGIQEQNSSFQDPQIKCDSYNTAITIDGNDEEWKADRTSIINKKTAVGFCRDDGFLYIRLLTSDPEFSMQIMNFGLTLWFDPQGSQNKVVGVQFPILQLSPPPPKGGGRPPIGDELQKFLDKRLKDVVIEFPENKNIRRMSMDEANKHGIDAKIGVAPGSTCYELQYPLHKSSVYTMGLGLNNQKYVDICIETPEIDKLMEKLEKSRKSPEAGRLRDASNQKIKPKPPQKLTRISQWVRVFF